MTDIKLHVRMNYFPCLKKAICNFLTQHLNPTHIDKTACFKPEILVIINQP